MFDTGKRSAGVPRLMTGRIQGGIAIVSGTKKLGIVSLVHSRDPLRGFRVACRCSQKLRVFITAFESLSDIFWCRLFPCVL